MYEEVADCEMDLAVLHIDWDKKRLQSKNK